MSSKLSLKGRIVEKTINKKTYKRKKNNKKMGLKFDRKKPNKDEIWKKNIPNKKNATKKIRTKLESLNNHMGEKLKIICNMIHHL